MSEQSTPHTDLPSPDALGELLGKILGSQVQGGSQIPTDAGQPIAAAALSTENSGSGQAGDIFSSLLSNPELLIKLPSIISAAKPIIEMLSQSRQSSASAEQPSASARATSPISVAASTSAQNNHTPDRRAALLCAMKPYLGKDRQQTVDYIIKLSRLGDILKTL